jgi:hypothetical protein
VVGGFAGARCSVPLLSELASGRFFFRGEAIIADAANFGAGNGDVDVTIAGNLLLELLVEMGFEFADLAATQTGDMDVVPRAMSFVIVPIAAEMEEIELVDETFFFEEVDGAVDGDEMDFGADFLRAIEDLIDVEVLLGGVHDLEDDAALAGQTDAAFAQSFGEVPGGIGSVDALAGGGAMRGGG